jgi:hypothetical protein
MLALLLWCVLSPSKDDSQSLATLHGSAWGSENQMLAFFTTSTEGLAKVQTVCTTKNKVVETDVICCPQERMSESLAACPLMMTKTKDTPRSCLSETHSQAAIALQV